MEELKKYNGKEGRRAYIAHKGTVYDITDSDMWQNGEHENIHNAGEDLTDALSGAPHGDEVFKKFKIVGKLESPQKEEPPKHHPKNGKARFRELYKTYHPHPISVHFPIALHFFAAFFDILFFLNGDRIYEQIVFYSFAVATLMGVLAMVFGIFSWWVNYDFSRAKYFVIKLYVSILTLILGIIGVSIYAIDQNAVYDYTPLGIVYHFLVFATVGTIIILGYYGGKITWGALDACNEKVKSKTSATAQKQNGSSDIHIPNIATEITYPKILSREITTQTLAQKELSDLCILIGGAAGTGINTIEKLISHTLKAKGIYHFITREYMSRVRGGSNTTLIRIADSEVSAPKWNADIFFAMDKDAYPHTKARLDNALVITDKNIEINHPDLRKIPIKTSIEDLGEIYANSYVFGYLCAGLGLEIEDAVDSIKTLFEGKGEKENLEALQKGFEANNENGKYNISRMFAQMKKDEGFMNGTDSVGFGLLTGGINFVSSYPMSPSTGVLNFMANISKNHPIVVEQAEDEIAAFNMIQGAWYTGTRGLTTTSGGGFALMCEGMSLAGMTETPAVVYLAQRPGPATGLPTRTEQGDLNLALYAGHGEFPRILLAPGDNEEAVALGYFACEVADFYQVPVVILSDQYFADSIKTARPIDFDQLRPHNYLVKSAAGYQRYAKGENGISPRSVPMYGDGLVCCDSDEHDERGQITESYMVREAAVQKRKTKAALIAKNAIAPTLYGEGDILVIGWGSTKGTIKEVVEKIGNVAFIHFGWIYPLNKEHLQNIEAFKKVIVIENNSNAQFADLLKLYGIKCDKTILCSNGFPFFVDKLYDELQNTLKELR